MLRGILSPLSTRKMLGRAQDMYGRGYDSGEIADNTRISAGKSIVGGILTGVTGGMYSHIGGIVNQVHGIRTKLNENDPGWRKKI